MYDMMSSAPEMASAWLVGLPRVGELALEPSSIVGSGDRDLAGEQARSGPLPPGRAAWLKLRKTMPP